ncbi:hypothetical protein K438DRAFT_2136389 [Mycena galopus ATCC 62051]|nr:hypothetical protein K438DRAFT_2136389 [Mycena galopus ATCC 62051]
MTGVTANHFGGAKELRASSSSPATQPRRRPTPRLNSRVQGVSESRPELATPTRGRRYWGENGRGRCVRIHYLLVVASLDGNFLRGLERQRRSHYFSTTGPRPILSVRIRWCRHYSSPFAGASALGGPFSCHVRVGTYTDFSGQCRGFFWTARGSSCGASSFHFVGDGVLCSWHAPRAAFPFFPPYSLRFLYSLLPLSFPPPHLFTLSPSFPVLPVKSPSFSSIKVTSLLVSWPPLCLSLLPVYTLQYPSLLLCSLRLPLYLVAAQHRS